MALVILKTFLSHSAYHDNGQFAIELLCFNGALKACKDAISEQIKAVLLEIPGRGQGMGAVARNTKFDGLKNAHELQLSVSLGCNVFPALNVKCIFAQTNGYTTGTH